MTVLFPGLPPAGVESLRGCARFVDAVRFGEAGVEWEWALENVVLPESQPWTRIILGMDAIRHADRGDQLEFLLQVVWTDRGRLAVDAAVNVACWCEPDHASHDVGAFRLEVPDLALLPRAFEEGAERLIGWLADPRDADGWRAEAGLPARWTDQRAEG